jgi:hypothetical protein
VATTTRRIDEFSMVGDRRATPGGGAAQGLRSCAMQVGWIRFVEQAVRCYLRLPERRAKFERAGVGYLTIVPSDSTLVCRLPRVESPVGRFRRR